MNRVPHSLSLPLTPLGLSRMAALVGALAFVEAAVALLALLHQIVAAVRGISRLRRERSGGRQAAKKVLQEKCLIQINIRLYK